MSPWLQAGTSGQRPSWLDYAAGLARVAQTRSADPWVKIGAVVLAADKAVVGIGYNGAPAGIEIPFGWTREQRRPLMIHAEVNALRECTPSRVAGGFLLATGVPCNSCLAVVAAYGIKRVHFLDELENYPIAEARQLADHLGLILTRHTD